jgi:hypothetical protein
MALRAGNPLRTERGGPELAFGRVEAGVLHLHLAGDWRLRDRKTIIESEYSTCSN